MTGQQGSAVALASLFTFTQKEQQLEGWERYLNNCAAACLARQPGCIYQHRDLQSTCNTDWIAAIIPHRLEHEIAGTAQEFALMIFSFSLLCVWSCTRVPL